MSLKEELSDTGFKKGDEQMNQAIYGVLMLKSSRFTSGCERHFRIEEKLPYCTHSKYCQSYGEAHCKLIGKAR